MMDVPSVSHGSSWGVVLWGVGGVHYSRGGDKIWLTSSPQHLLSPRADVSVYHLRMTLHLQAVEHVSPSSTRAATLKFKV